MSFINPDKKQLINFKALLKSEKLCYDDLAGVTILRIKTDITGQIQSGYGLEIFDGNALLRSVIVNQILRGRGSGSETVKDALNVARESGVKTIFLLTTTAERFFRKFGFISIPRNSVPESIANTNEFSNFCPDTASCMKLKLSNRN